MTDFVKKRWNLKKTKWSKVIPNNQEPNPQIFGQHWDLRRKSSLPPWSGAFSTESCCFLVLLSKHGNTRRAKDLFEKTERGCVGRKFTRLEIFTAFFELFPFHGILWFSLASCRWKAADPYNLRTQSQIFWLCLVCSHPSRLSFASILSYHELLFDKILNVI